MVEQYIDQKTGRTSDRDAFQRLFQNAYQRKFDLVFFWALDRFSREGAGETLAHLQKLTAYGILWKCYTEPYIDSAGMSSDVIVSLLATLAKQESVRRSERASAAYPLCCHLPIRGLERSPNQLSIQRTLDPQRASQVLSWWALLCL